MGDLGETDNKGSQEVDSLATSSLIARFEDLRVFEQAYDLAIRIFQISKSFPSEEKYELTSQARRASRSVCTNIAEAWGKRRYPQHFVSKLSDSYGEALETELWLRFARDFTYITCDLYDELFCSYEQVCGSLVKMMAKPEKWCGPRALRRFEKE